MGYPPARSGWGIPSARSGWGCTPTRVTPQPGQVGGSPLARSGCGYPPPHQVRMGLGHVMPRAVCLLRFPAGLSCLNHFFLFKFVLPPMIPCCNWHSVPFLPDDVAIISSTRLYFLMVLLSSSMCLSFSSFAAISDSTAFLSFSTSVST